MTANRMPRDQLILVGPTGLRKRANGVSLICFTFCQFGNGLEIFRDSYLKLPKISPGAIFFKGPF